MRVSNFSRLLCIFFIIPSREEPAPMFELHLRQFLPKTVSRCQGKCGKKITQDDGMLIKTYGNTRWTDKKVGKQMSKHGPMYKTSLKRQTKKYYGPDKRFVYSIITMADETHNLSDEKNDFLKKI